MTWTKKHDEFALVCQLRPSTRLILRWILRRAKLSEVSEIEIDLKVFNAWLAKKRGSGFDRKTLNFAMNQLDNQSQGMVIIAKRYTPWIFKLIVRPLEMVLKDNAKNSGIHPKPPTVKPMFDADHKQRLEKQQQQDISKLNSIFSQVGLVYSHDAILRIWRLAGRKIESIRKAVELMLYQNSTQSEPIRKAHGWLVSCLKNNWQENFNLYYQPELPKFESVFEIEKFTSLCFT